MGGEKRLCHTFKQAQPALIMKIPAIIGFMALFLPQNGGAQKLSPKWYGRAETKTRSSYNSYLCEMVIEKKGNQISGNLNYFFGQQEHLVKITGIYWPQTKTIELYPFNLITHFAKDQNSPDCQVDGSLTLYIDNGDSILYGQLNPVSKYRNMCPILTISLNKENTEDFGPDPDIPRPTDAGDTLSDSLRTGLAIVPDDVVISKPVEDSTQKVLPVEILRTQPVGPTAGIHATMPPMNMKDKKVGNPEFTKRNFQEGPLILVDTDTIILHLYDNGQVDHDSVSVFFNRMPLVENQPLGLTPIIIKLLLKPGENEIALFAENLGDIPPNTALCLIFSGEKRYDINLMSNLASNGTIRIRRH